jgi:NAD(P)-dependent dehydrogenase (short-subunit alcohol dehydrogenase family)
MAEGTVVIVGGTSGLGRMLAERFASEGREVLITGRDAERTAGVAAEIGKNVRSAALDLAEPQQIAGRLPELGAVDHLVLTAIERDSNSVRDYSIEGAIRLTTLKLVGYTEVIHALLPKLHDESSVLLFGGLAKDRPYPGSTTVTTVNGGIQTMVRTLGTELAPIRFNAIHPGIVGDTPAWEGKQQALDNVLARTPTGRLVTMVDVIDACLFLLRNRSVNGINLQVDGGWMML